MVRSRSTGGEITIVEEGVVHGGEPGGSPSQRTSTARVGLLGLGLALGACSDFGDDGRDPNVVAKTFAPVQELTVLQVDAILQAAALSSDAQDVAIAVLDRIGNPLRLYLRGVSASAGPNPDYALLTAAERARLNFATAVARAAAFLSHSQAPLTSRTGQFLNAFHFPAVFAKTQYLTLPPFAFADQTLPVQATIGVANTAQAPLWQIEASNRGTPFESASTNPVTTYTPPMAIPIAANPDGSAPAPGLGLLPGGVPLYDLDRSTAEHGMVEAGFDVKRRLSGAIGVYVTDANGLPLPDLAEFMAIAGARALDPLDPDPGTPETFDIGVRPEGGVFLVGILLPNTEADPSGTGSGSFDAADEVSALNVVPDGAVDPGEQYLIDPRDSASLFCDGLQPDLSAAEVMTIIEACRDVSQETHAAIRLPANSPCKMIISVCDRDGVLLGVYREEDATLFSLEISITKARNAVFFSNPDSRWTTDAVEAGVLAGLHPLTGFRARRDVNGDLLPILDDSGNLLSANGDVVDIFPPGVLTTTGVAITARTLGFLSQPFFPPGIDSQPDTAPLFFLALKNRFPQSFVGQGFAARSGSGDPNEPAYPDTQSGIIFFPGSAPLYRDGCLIGGIGVSGDGVEQDDFVTAKGIERAQDVLGFLLEAPRAIRADRFSFEGTGIPYFKFPQNPGG